MTYTKLFNPFSHSLNLNNDNKGYYNPIKTDFVKEPVYIDGDFAIYEYCGGKAYFHCYKHVIFNELCGINKQLITDLKNNCFCGVGNQYHQFDRPKYYLEKGLEWSKEYEEFN